MTAVEAAKLLRLQVQWEGEKQRRMDKARAAIERYECTPNERRRKASLRAIELCSLSASSENRLSQVLSLIEFAPRGILLARVYGRVVRM